MSRPRSKYAKTDVRPAIGAWLRDARRLYRRTDDVSQKKGALPMPLDLSKPVQTRDGRKVRILCTDRKAATHERRYPVVALVSDRDGADECVYYFTLDGEFNCFGRDQSSDLVNVPEPERAVWVNVFIDRDGEEYFDQRSYPSRVVAIASAPSCSSKLLACIEVKYRPGQGIE